MRHPPRGNLPASTRTPKKRIRPKPPIPRAHAAQRRGVPSLRRQPPRGAREAERVHSAHGAGRGGLAEGSGIAIERRRVSFATGRHPTVAFT